MDYKAERVEDIPIPPPANYIGQAVDHPCFADFGDDVVFRDPIPFENRLDGHRETGLTRQEIEHFKTRGFIVKQGLIDDKKGFEGLVEYMWDQIPPRVMDKNDTSTWVDSPASRITSEEAQRIGHFQGTRFKIRSPGKLGTEKFMLDLTANHPNLRQVVDQFLCAPVQQSKRARGLYAVFPKPVADTLPLGPHVDPLSSHLLAMVIVAEIPPRSGGFTVWPGSHLRLHPYFDTRQGGSITDSKRLAGFLQERDRILKTVTPVEFVGSAGDVVFWHPRLIHSAGVNYSAETDKPCIRVVVPCDFQRDGHTFYDEEMYGPSEREMWWIDSRHYREDVPPTPDNIWMDWVI